MKDIIGLAALMAALSGGAMAQTGAPAPVAKDPSLSVYAKPQRLVTLPDGRRINLDCAGHGSPTVILSAGLNSWAAVWSNVQGAIARRTRVCAWDQAGLGWSDPSPEPQDAVHIAADLAGALKAGGIAGPYVMVGHSAGAYVALSFTDRHRSAVKGMVLVDPSIPDQFALEEKIHGQLVDMDRKYVRDRAAELHRCAAMVKAGGAPGDACTISYPQFPDDLVAALRPGDADPARQETRASIEEQFEASGRLAVNPRRDYGTLPLAVLTAGKPIELGPGTTAEQAVAVTAQWRSGHDALAALSRRGSNRVVEGSGHMIQLEKPEAVIAAVGEVLDQTGSRARAPVR